MFPFFLDIDECHLWHEPCSHFCTNTLGSFVCSCPPGFELQGDTNCIGKCHKRNFLFCMSYLY